MVTFKYNENKKNIHYQVSKFEYTSQGVGSH